MNSKSRMTDVEIDALTLPKGWAPVRGEPSASDRRISARMVDACAARFGWSDDQKAAALEVALRVPLQGVKGKRMIGAEPLPALQEAARRAC